jgi:hypothetical protein
VRYQPAFEHVLNHEVGVVDDSVHSHSVFSSIEKDDPFSREQLRGNLLNTLSIDHERARKDKSSPQTQNLAPIERLSEAKIKWKATLLPEQSN